MLPPDAQQMPPMPPMPPPMFQVPFDVSFPQVPHIAPLVTTDETMGHAEWTLEDEALLISFLKEHKAEAGNGANFKKPVWEAAGRFLSERRTRGGVKKADSCKSKYAKVGSAVFYEVFSPLITLS